MASAYWESRNARARSLGYRNYYDYRVHNYGAEAPETPRPAGERLSQLRGHRGSKDLLQLARTGRIELLKVLPQARDKRTGQWESLTARATLKDGSEQEFTLRGHQIERGTGFFSTNKAWSEGDFDSEDLGGGPTGTGGQFSGFVEEGYSDAVDMGVYQGTFDDWLDDLDYLDELDYWLDEYGVDVVDPYGALGGGA